MPRARVCGCGHEESWHLANARDPKAPRGQCNYGADTTFGRCLCTAFHRKRRGDRAYDVDPTAHVWDESTGAPPELVRQPTAVSPIADAFAKLVAGVNREFDAFRAVLRSSSFEVQKGAPATPTAPRVVHRETKPAKAATGERAILIAIAQHHAQGGVSREQLGVLTGYRRSTRNTYLQRLAARGLIREWPDGDVHATDAGFNELGPSFEPLPTGTALRDHWLRTLSGGEQTILDLIAKQGPLDGEEISVRTSYARSSRNTYLQRLKARGLIVQDSEGYSLSPWLTGRGAA